MGRRRLAAAISAGLATLPAMLRDVDDEQLILEQLTENRHRAPLNPIDQAVAYQRALELLELTQAKLAQRLAISQPQISNTLRLLSLPTEVRELVASGSLGAAHARELLKLDDDASRIALAAQIVAEGLTVRQASGKRAESASPVPRADLSQLLVGLRDARMFVTMKGDRARITLDVRESDVESLLEQLGRAA